MFHFIKQIAKKFKVIQVIILRILLPVDLFFLRKDFNPSKITRPMISDGKITETDKKGKIDSGQNIDTTLQNAELDKAFETFAQDVSTPYAKVESSGRIITAIYKFFNDSLYISIVFFFHFICDNIAI